MHFLHLLFFSFLVSLSRHLLLIAFVISHLTMSHHFLVLIIWSFILICYFVFLLFFLSLNASFSINLQGLLLTLSPTIWCLLCFMNFIYMSVLMGSRWTMIFHAHMIGSFERTILTCHMFQDLLILDFLWPFYEFSTRVQSNDYIIPYGNYLVVC